jgi:hypothetical protein
MRLCFPLCFLLAVGALAVLLTNQPVVAADAPAWGSIKGQVVFAGDKMPEMAELQVTKDQAHCLSKGKLFSDEWVIGKESKGVANVFVWLVPADLEKKTLDINPNLKAPEKPAVIDQPCCAFVPHAVAVREGQDLLLKNGSPVAHNANLLVDTRVNTGVNVLIPAGGEATVKALKRQKAVIALKCDIHPWMKANVWVFDHPYYAITDADGKFEIKDAPAGDVRIKIWHDSGWLGGAAGKDGQKITIKPGASSDLGKFELK